MFLANWDTSSVLKVLKSQKKKKKARNMIMKLGREKEKVEDKRMRNLLEEYDRIMLCLS